MKMWFVLFAIVCLTFNIYAQDSITVKNNSGTLILNVTGFENDEGSLRVALSDSKENYTSDDMPFRTAIVSIKDKTSQSIFKDLVFGTYGIKIFHDENDNEELDTNFLGIPSENYGFSNNADGTFGPASWEDAKFEFNLDSMVIEINME